MVAIITKSKKFTYEEIAYIAALLLFLGPRLPLLLLRLSLLQKSLGDHDLVFSRNAPVDKVRIASR